MVLLTVAVLGSLALEIWVLPATVDQVVRAFPETKIIAVPSIVWGIVATLCWQVAALAGIRVLALAGAGKFDASATVWLRAVIGCLCVFVLLVVFAWTALTTLTWAPPAALLGLLVSGGAAIVAVVVIVRVAHHPRSGAALANVTATGEAGSEEASRSPAHAPTVDL
jgi:hypothetical protein